MNDRERFRRLLPIIEAYAQGQQLQYNYDGTWTDWPSGTTQAFFSSEPQFYRIRPQPREVWIAEGAFDSSGDTVGMAYRNPGHSVRYIKLREVLGDD